MSIEVKMSCKVQIKPIKNNPLSAKLKSKQKLSKQTIKEQIKQ